MLNNASDTGNEIIQFFSDPTVVNRDGFCLNDFMQWDNVQLERRHNYIQWIFPNHNASSCHLNAPRLTTEVRDVLCYNAVCAANWQAAWEKMLQFWNLPINYEQFADWSELPSWVSRLPSRLDHNYLRITRMMICGVWLNRSPAVHHIYDYLIRQHSLHNDQLFNPITILHWTSAKYGVTYQPPRIVPQLRDPVCR